MTRFSPDLFARLGRCLAVLGALALLAGCANVRTLDTPADASQANATLFVPYQFQVQAIDSTVLRDSFVTFDGRDQRLRVAPGEHTLVLRYFDLIATDGRRMDDYARVLSEPITLRFVAEANEAYAVVGPRPDQPSAARLFAADPELAVVENASERVVSGDIEVAEPEADEIRRGNTVYRAVADAVRGDRATVEPAESGGTGVAATGAAVSGAATAGAANTASAAANSSGAGRATAAADTPQPAPGQTPPQSLQMLKYWWNTADEATRERFEAWREQR